MDPEYTIRQEQPADYAEVESLTREAFWNVYRPGCVEHYLVHSYRQLPEFVPELSCVLELDGRIAAHIMYSRAEVALDGGGILPVLVLGPVSVRPELQRRGLGGRLIRHTLDAAAERGFGAVVLSGSPEYYSRFGFTDARSLGIRYAGVPEEVPTPFFMVRELRAGYLAGVTGSYADPPGYAVSDEDVEAFDARFPPREKLKLPDQLQ